MDNFMFILFLLTVVSGAAWLVDSLWRKPKSQHASPVTDTQKPALEKPSCQSPWLIKQAKSFFPVFLIVLLIRSFVGQLVHVPSQSLEPTVLPGDLILVDQFSYGLHMPVWNNFIIKTGQPQRGDIAVFRWPANPKADFVKRVVGVPGDDISYQNDVLTINGKVMQQTFIHTTEDSNSPTGPHWKVRIMQENLAGVKHKIYLCATGERCPGQAMNFTHLKVPAGQYFMMGDNRVDSDDSRYWGLVPANNFVGKARIVLMNWNQNATLANKIQWHRIAHRLNA